MKGIIVWYSVEKMYGFIESDHGGDLFMHKSGLADSVYYPNKGDTVTFEIENTADGRTRAVNVKKSNEE